MTRCRVPAIDAVEQPLREADLAVDGTGYAIVKRPSDRNLQLGRIVIADCVNLVLASRVGWRQSAFQSSARMVEIEVICSDLALHRQRVERRSSDISSLKLPTWDEIVNRDCEPWDQEHLVLDSAESTLAHLFERAENYVATDSVSCLGEERT